MTRTVWLFPRCTMKRVIDGDSVEIIADLGFGVAATVSVRLLGVDTPERGKEGYAEATEFTRTWLANAEGLRFECSGKDKYGGRWLGTLRDGMGESLTDSLIAAGMGVAYSGGKKAGGAGYGV